MQAKLNNLKKIKEKYEGKNEDNMTRINFINNVKERMRNDA
jgi:hypothetical protein